MRRDKGTKRLGIVAFDEASEATYMATTIRNNGAVFEAWIKDYFIEESSSFSKQLICFMNEC